MDLIYESNENKLNKDIMQLYEEGKIICLPEETGAYANRKYLADIFLMNGDNNFIEKFNG